ncbi:translation initiation factor IF-2-like isoform X2 [Monodelphis domestica]|uniref:translation initiation factor IF-2-like isoform X2 n=1 Tax=Monodelphis domestica TaxID=13616 RepID=UPI0024E1AAB6|nr:translation initiation factor IF-2-like isoform X2 [Monodelphis domestica]
MPKMFFNSQLGMVGPAYGACYWGRQAGSRWAELRAARLIWGLLYGWPPGGPRSGPTSSPCAPSPGDPVSKNPKASAQARARNRAAGESSVLFRSHGRRGGFPRAGAPSRDPPSSVASSGPLLRREGARLTDQREPGLPTWPKTGTEGGQCGRRCGQPGSNPGKPAPREQGVKSGAGGAKTRLACTPSRLSFQLGKQRTQQRLYCLAGFVAEPSSDWRDDWSHQRGLQRGDEP